MKLTVLLLLVANVFGQTKLRGFDTGIIESELVTIDESHWKEFTNFQEKFSKRYSTIQELESRFAIFKNNLVGILAHNADLSQNFTMGINQFTDLTPEEFKAQYIGGLKTEVGSYGCKSFSSTDFNLPVSIIFCKSSTSMPAINRRLRKSSKAVSASNFSLSTTYFEPCNVISIFI